MSDFLDNFFTFWGLCELERDLKLCAFLSKSLLSSVLGDFVSGWSNVDDTSFAFLACCLKIVATDTDFLTVTGVTCLVGGCILEQARNSDQYSWFWSYPCSD
jgi:hypothetical protein